LLTKAQWFLCDTSCGNSGDAGRSDDVAQPQAIQDESERACAQGAAALQRACRWIPRQGGEGHHDGQRGLRTVGKCLEIHDRNAGWHLRAGRFKATLQSIIDNYKGNDDILSTARQKLGVLTGKPVKAEEAPAPDTSNDNKPAPADTTKTPGQN